MKNKELYLITGGTSGIGKGVVLKLNQLGHFVIVVGRSNDKLELIRQEARYPENILFESKDLSKSEGLDKWVLNLSKKHGKLKGCVLSAGIQQIMAISSPLSIEKCKELFEVNFFSNMQIAKGFCDRRVNIGKGSSVVFISSIASIRGNSGLVCYAASKGAINSAVKSLAKEVARYGIRVNAILPGFVMTEMIEKWKKVYNEDFIKKIDKEYPLGLGKVEHVVEPILFLLSDEAKWITGCELVVDGGGSL